jgi:molecular chaperone DnaK
VQDAEAHASEDKERRDLAEAKNQAEALIHQTEKQLADLGDKVSAEDRSAVETGIAALKGVTDSGNLGELQLKTQALLQAAMKMGEALYGAQGQAGGESDSSGGSDDVVDAEFEEVDENGKKRA